MEDKKPKQGSVSAEYDKFRALATKIVAVPKREIDAREAGQKAQAPKKS